MPQFRMGLLQAITLINGQRQYKFNYWNEGILNVNAVGLYTVNVTSPLAAVEYERSKSHASDIASSKITVVDLANTNTVTKCYWSR
jgi:hypothetical protein